MYLGIGLACRDGLECELIFSYDPFIEIAFPEAGLNLGANRQRHQQHNSISAYHRLAK